MKLRLSLAICLAVAILAHEVAQRPDAWPLNPSADLFLTSGAEETSDDDDELVDADDPTDDEELADDEQDLADDGAVLTEVAAAEEPEGVTAPAMLFAQQTAPSSGLRAPQIGTAQNPFSNTCDGKAIGFTGPSGDRPRMQLTAVPSGARLQCRTGLAKAVSQLPFAPCDGADGSKPVHTPALSAEGRHRTEVRYLAAGKTSAVASVSYYVHRSLDGVGCCQSPFSDARWFDAARPVLAGPATFTALRLENPLIQIPRPKVVLTARKKKRKAPPVQIVRPAFGRDNATTLMSLRRTFQLSSDGKLLLIRRTTASRYALAHKDQNACVGLRIAAPVRRATCRGFHARQSPYHMGTTKPRCPGLYCTVTTCDIAPTGCRRITHTFNRGPGQQPWVRSKTTCSRKMPMISLTRHQCDAYVLNARGQGVCLAAAGGAIRIEKAFTDDRGTGLRILEQQRWAVRQTKVESQFVFSPKTTRVNVKNALFLPD